MQRVTRSTAVAVLPAPPAGAGAPGYFGGGDAATGTPATVPGYEWCNLVQEELMSVVLAAGLTPSASDYDQLLEAIQYFVSAGTIPTGAMLPFPASAAPAGWAKANGITVPRTGSWAALWAYAQSSGNLVTDAAWLAGRPGSFSSGDGSTTFRIPDLRGLFLRGYHDGSGTYESATGTALGAYRDSQNKTHTHQLYADDNISVGGGGTSDAGRGSSNLIANFTASSGGVEAYPRHVTTLWCIKL
jgi:hypothetical protein